MARHLNKVILIGQTGGAAEVQYLSSGVAKATVGLALNSRWMSDGEAQERTDWVNLEFWGKQAENASSLLNTSKLIQVEGEIRQDKWTTDDGQSRSKTYVRCNYFNLITPRGNSNGANEPRADEPQGVQIEIPASV